MFRKQKSTFHSNFLLLAKSGGVFIILNCVCILVVHSVHQFIYHFQNAPCGAFFVRWQCLTMRGMGYLAIVGFNHTQFAFFLERCLAVLFVSKYEYSMKYAGAVLVVVLKPTTNIRQSPSFNAFLEVSNPRKRNNYWNHTASGFGQ
uniref:7TM_GPCR_Srx domain-containing protein n=1 Tax=Panagrellus redivivus TaxID=6233 RepID=A0A7E4VR52_PANRE